MTYDQGLEHRIEQLTTIQTLTKKKMFGGVIWFLNGNMCTGIHKDYLILRIGKINAQLLANNKYVSDYGYYWKTHEGVGKNCARWNSE